VIYYTYTGAVKREDSDGDNHQTQKIKSARGMEGAEGGRAWRLVSLSLSLFLSVRTGGIRRFGAVRLIAGRFPMNVRRRKHDVILTDGTQLGHFSEQSEVNKSRLSRVR